MLKLITIIGSLVIICCSTYGQNTFSRLISTPYNEKVFRCAEDQNGNYILVGQISNYEPLLANAKIWILDQEGHLIQELEFELPDSVSYFGDVYCMADTILIFGAKGPLNDDLWNRLWILSLSENLNVNFNKSYDLGGYNLVDFEIIINHEGNYVLCGMGTHNSDWPDIYFFKLSNTCDSLIFSCLILEQPQIEFDLRQSSDDNGYKVFATGVFPGAPSTGGVIIYFDQDFNYIGGDSIPMDLYHLNTVNVFSDTSYLLTGKVTIYEPVVHQHLGVVELNNDDELLNYAHFGMEGDTISNPAVNDNLDFISKDNIYYGGTSNIIPSQWPYQIEDSWLIMNNIDSNLNLNWQKYYGGDAFYYMWGLLATQDGGCLMYATRYDEQTQYQENDVIIIKVDSNGLLTSTEELAVFDPGDISVFPNPASHIVTISLFPPASPATRQYKLYIRDIMGRETEFIPIENLHQPRRIHIDVSGYPSGLYFISLESGAFHTSSAKMMIAR